MTGATSRQPLLARHHAKAGGSTRCLDGWWQTHGAHRGPSSPPRADRRHCSRRRCGPIPHEGWLRDQQALAARARGGPAQRTVAAFRYRSGPDPGDRTSRVWAGAIGSRRWIPATIGPRRNDWAVWVTRRAPALVGHRCGRPCWVAKPERAVAARLLSCPGTATSRGGGRVRPAGHRDVPSRSSSNQDRRRLVAVVSVVQAAIRKSGRSPRLGTCRNETRPRGR
jgi:hypothetical protein